MDLPLELKDYVWDIYIFNLKYRVLRNRPYLLRVLTAEFNQGERFMAYYFICPFAMKSFRNKLIVALNRRVSHRVRKQIEAKSFYKSLKPRRFFDI